MTLRKCLLAPWKRLQQSLRASAMLQRLLQSGPRRHRVPRPHSLRNCLLAPDPPKLAFVTLKPSLGLAAPPAPPQSLRNASEIASERSLSRHRVPWPHSVFMTLRNWLLTPWNPSKVSQRLPHLLLWPSETASWHLETLLRPRSASGILFYDPRKVPLAPWKPSLGLAAPPAIPRSPKVSQRLPHLLLWPSETASWHLETPLRPRSASGILFYDPPKMPFVALKASLCLAAPPAPPQSLRNASEIASERSLRRHRAPWPHSVFMTLRNWLLTAWNPPKVSQRLPHLLLWPSETASWHLETLLRPRSASGILFFDPPKVPFGTLKTFLRPRSASSNPSEPRQCLRDCFRAVPEGTVCLGHTPFVFMTFRNCLFGTWRSESAFCHLESFLRPRSASSTPPEPQECLRDCLRAVPQKAPCALATLCFYDPPKLTFGTLKPS